MAAETSTGPEAQDFTLPTQVRLPMAGGMPVAFREAWRAGEAERAAITTRTGLDDPPGTPTGPAAAQAMGLQAAADPVTEQAVMRPLTPPPVVLRIRERWDGVVMEVHSEERFFTARVVPLGRDEPELFADFHLDKVDEQDLPLVAVGALFFAISGYIPVGPGQRIQASTLRFRRLAKWRTDDVDFMRAAARKRRAALGLNDPE